MFARYFLGNFHCPLVPSATAHRVSVIASGSFEDHAEMIVSRLIKWFYQIFLSAIKIQEVHTQKDTYLSKQLWAGSLFVDETFVHSFTRKYPMWFAVASYSRLIIPPALYCPVIVPSAYFPGAMNVLVPGLPPQMLHVSGVTKSKCAPQQYVWISSQRAGVLNPYRKADTLEAGSLSLPIADTLRFYKRSKMRFNKFMEEHIIEK